jgi:hypothetical protein
MASLQLAADASFRPMWRVLGLVFLALCWYSGCALVWALLNRQPFHQNGLVVSLGISFAMLVVARRAGPIAGLCAALGVVAVHFGFAWIGVRLTSGSTHALLFDFMSFVVLTLAFWILLTAYVLLRRPEGWLRLKR